MGSSYSVENWCNNLITADITVVAHSKLLQSGETSARVEKFT